MGWMTIYIRRLSSVPADIESLCGKGGKSNASDTMQETEGNSVNDHVLWTVPSRSSRADAVSAPSFRVTNVAAAASDIHRDFKRRSQTRLNQSAPAAPSSVRQPPSTSVVSLAAPRQSSRRAEFQPGQTTKQIEMIEVGDLVWAWDEAEGGLIKRQVNRLFRHADKPVLDVVCVSAEGSKQTIAATTEHPFWVVGKGWVATCELATGDLLARIDGAEPCRILGVKNSGRTAEVFNFEVDRAHNYFVGSPGVLVHNASQKYVYDVEETVEGKIVAVTSANWTSADNQEVVDGFNDLRSGVAKKFRGSIFISHGSNRRTFGNMKGDVAGSYIRDRALALGGQGEPLSVIACSLGDSGHRIAKDKPVILDHDPSIIYAALSNGEFPYLATTKLPTRFKNGEIFGAIPLADAEAWKELYGNDVIAPELSYDWSDEHPNTGETRTTRYVGVKLHAAKRVFLPVLNNEAVARIEGRSEVGLMNSLDVQQKASDFNLKFLSDFFKKPRGQAVTLYFDEERGLNCMSYRGKVSKIDGQILALGSSYTNSGARQIMKDRHLAGRFEIKQYIDTLSAEAQAQPELHIDRTVPIQQMVPLQNAFAWWATAPR